MTENANEEWTKEIVAEERKSEEGRREERNAEGQIKSEEGRRMKEGRRRNGKWEWGGEMDSRASA